MIAIWTTTRDTTADRVQRELERRRAAVVRVDTDRYGIDYRLGWDLSRPYLLTQGRRLAASEISSIYYRRPTVTEVPRSERDFGVHETWYFSRAVLMLAESASWMNHPSAVMMAENKLRQLSMAVQCRLCVPRSQLVATPEEAFAFYETVGRRCVCKPGFAGIVSNDEKKLAVYAWRLHLDLGRDDFQSVTNSPTFLQEEVQKIADIRLTVVGDEMFAVRISTKKPMILDWRSQLGDDDSLGYEHLVVPPQTASRVRALMRSLGLSYGALDFAEGVDGEWWFLEVNPAGQWEWLEPAADVPISATIASWLEQL